MGKQASRPTDTNALVGSGSSSIPQIARAGRVGPAYAARSPVNLLGGLSMSARFHRAQLLVVAFGLLVTVSAAEAQSAVAKVGARHSVTVVVRELGPLVAGGSSTAVSINNRGAVVGEATTETGRFIPFLWTPQRGFDRILGDVRGFARDINDAGDVIGIYFSTDDDLEPGKGFLWSTTHGFVDLGDFEPQAINNRGQIAGTCRPVLRACLWEHGVVTRLGVLPGHQFSMAFGISDRGHVVGQSFGAGEGGLAFVWKPRTGMVALESPAGSVAALGINNRGQMAGTMSTSTGLRAVVWSKEGLIVRLGPADDFTTSGPINARGWVIGHQSVRSFVWLPSGEMHILGDPGTIAIGRGINNRGQVAGYIDGGDDPTSRPTAVVWTVRASNSQTAP